MKVRGYDETQSMELDEAFIDRIFKDGIVVGAMLGGTVVLGIIGIVVALLSL